MLAFAGGTAALLLASGGVRFVIKEGPLAIPRLRDAELNSNVMLFTVAITVITGILFGISPALRSSHTGPEEALKRSARTAASTSRGHQRLNDVLIVSEIALTLVLMTGAALMLKSLWLMSSTSAQYAPEEVLSTRVEGPNLDSAPAGQIRRFLDESDESIHQIEAIPGVRAAGTFVTLLTEEMELPELPKRMSPNELMETRLVSPHFFQAAGLRLLAGANLLIRIRKVHRR
jgi:putative ABC transport system permease protein